MVTTRLQKLKTDELIKMILQFDRKFRRARCQILILNRSIVALLARYNRAKDERYKCCRTAIRLQLNVMEPMRNLFYEYAWRQCQVIDDLQNVYAELTGEKYDNFEAFD